MTPSKKGGGKKEIDSYRHEDKERVNNPPVGLVTPDTDQDSGKKVYSYDPHLDPQLVWAGKAELTSFEVPTVYLHVHERIDPSTIIEAVRRHNWSNRMIAGDSREPTAHFRSSEKCAAKRMEMTTPYGRLNRSLTFGGA